MIDILSIDGPATAKAGDLVNLSIRVKNTHNSEVVWATLALTYDSAVIDTFEPPLLELFPRDEAIFTTSFTMPDKNITVKVYSYLWNGLQWIYQTDKQVGIGLDTGAPLEGVVQVQSVNTFVDR